MAEFLPKNLANGQLPNSKGTLYTVPTGNTSIAKSVVLVNTDSVERTVNLYVNFGTGSRRFIPKGLVLPAGAKFEDSSAITLEAGDFIEGDASAVSVIDFIVSGVNIIAD